MPSVGVRSEASGWLRPALVIVAIAVLTRWIALLLDRTDLFVDETQYWLWGQRLDFGYYSKPPLIGWLIRAVTEIARSDAQFWVRMPGAVLHGATALILGALTARIAGARAAVWTVALYVTLPFVALGSIMISTDTVMAPFYAGAVLFFWRAGDEGRVRDALLAGACVGAAFMAKYAAVYLILGMLLAMLVARKRRIGWRNAGLMVLAFLVVISPNVIWNLTHQFATVEHTMDNVGWVREGARLDWASMGAFLGAQFAVFGPVTMAALLWGFARPRDADKAALAVMAVPPLVAVTIQALLEKAYANWALAAYFPGVVLAVLVLPRAWRWLALGLGLIPALVLPALIVLAPWPERKGQPLLARYLGRSEMSLRLLALAKANDVPIYAENRDILADLYYTGRASGVAIYAPDREGRPMNYYEQNFALPEDYRGNLLVIRMSPLDCGVGNLPPAGLLNGSGTWKGRGMTPYLAPRECIHAED